MIIGTDIEHHQDDADTSNTPLSSISFTGTETAYNATGAKPACPTAATCSYGGNAWRRLHDRLSRNHHHS